MMMMSQREVRIRTAGLMLAMVWYLTVLVTSVVAVEANLIPEQHGEECEIAQMKCSYRANCYHALHSYMIDCADVLAGRTSRCPFACKRALISLTSSEAGLALAGCRCGDNEFCQRSKERLEVCRPEVSAATADGTVVSCSVAKWICAADPLCSTALDYYHRLCKPLFLGRRCTPRCNNSLAILDRQEKAAKLRRCYCDGSEEFPCHDILQNTERLCYGRHDFGGRHHHPATTTPEPSGVAKSSPCYLLMAFALILLSFRTCSRNNLEAGETFSTGDSAVNCTDNELRTVERYRDLLHVRNCHSSATSDRSSWPWWWTSEDQVT